MTSPDGFYFALDGILPAGGRRGSGQHLILNWYGTARFDEREVQILAECQERAKFRPDLSKKFFQSRFGFLIRRHGVTSDIFFGHVARIFDGVFEAFFFADFS